MARGVRHLWCWLAAGGAEDCSEEVLYILPLQLCFRGRTICVSLDWADKGDSGRNHCICGSVTLITDPQMQH